jgi:hypothetical protein
MKTLSCSRSRPAGRFAYLLGGALLAVVFATPAHGQEWGAWSRAGWAGGYHQREMMPSMREGFFGCWLAFNRVQVSGGKRGWDTDYPLAVRNFMWRLGEFTTAPINTYDDGGMADGIVVATDTNLFGCPFLFSSDVGGATFSEPEIEALRNYLLKGGFLWVDDFWGSQAMERWEAELARILPGYTRVLLDKDHPLMSTFYFFEEVPQMPSYQSWRRDGRSYEARASGSDTPSISAIVDERGRAMVVMTHNTDIGDAMEREGVDPTYFFLFSPKAYALAVNIALYAMTQ